MKSPVDTLAVAPPPYEIQDDTSRKRRLELNALMNQRLASAVDLQMQVKQAHWNVKESSLVGVHELFRRIAQWVESYGDLIAERIVKHGGIAQGTVRVSAAFTRLEEYPLAIADGFAHVDAVARALSSFGHEAQDSINKATDLNDADTADLFTEISRGIDQWLQFLHAQSQSRGSET